MQGEVFEGELAVAAAKKGQEAKQLEQEGDHRTRAHGLSREFLRKVSWRMPPGRRARLLQQTTPQNTDRQRAELAALLAE
ncbi:MAG TPA: hypothetical protein VFC23_18960, partial [Thermoanaerobaculia bacterium]|nr:hypothetical protein [Thermoanaerobaculia bacterium]